MNHTPEVILNDLSPTVTIQYFHSSAVLGQAFNQLVQDKVTQGMEERVQEEKSLGWIRKTVNVLWSFLVVFPLVVLFWRGTWNLLETYLLPANEEIWNHIVILQLLVCFATKIVFDCKKNLIGEWLRKRSTFVRCIGERLFIVTKAVIIVALFRSTWINWIFFTNMAKKSGDFVVAHIMTLGYPICLGIFKNLVKSPLNIVSDNHCKTFKKETLHRFDRLSPEGVTETGLSHAFLLWSDIFVTNFSALFGITMAYLTTWGILDFHDLFPSAEGCWSPLLVGGCLALLALLLDHLLQKLLPLTTNHLILRPLDLGATLTAFYACAILWWGVWRAQVGRLMFTNQYIEC